MPNGANGLIGLNVLVTRPSGSETGLVARIREAGGNPVHLPCISIEPLINPVLPAADEPIDLLVVVSANAARQLPPDRWTDARVAAIGSSTAAALKDMGRKVHITPAEGFTSEHLLAEHALRDLAGRRVLIARGEGGRQVLSRTLEERGAIVSHAVLYRRAIPDQDPVPPLKTWLDAELPVATFSSGEGLTNFAGMVPQPMIESLRNCAAIVPSDRVAAQAREIDLFAAVHAANDASDPATMSKLLEIAALATDNGRPYWQGP